MHIHQNRESSFYEKRPLQVATSLEMLGDSRKFITLAAGNQRSRMTLQMKNVR
jgi:hypothetical protein